MTNVNANPYWQRVGKARDGLQNNNFITSLGISREEMLASGRFDQNVAGIVCSADRETAARRIADGTHRLATAEEINKFHKDQQERDRFYAAESQKRKQTAVKILPSELAKALNLG